MAEETDPKTLVRYAVDTWIQCNAQVNALSGCVDNRQAVSAWDDTLAEAEWKNEPLFLPLARTQWKRGRPDMIDKLWLIFSMAKYARRLENKATTIELKDRMMLDTLASKKEGDT